MMTETKQTVFLRKTDTYAGQEYRVFRRDGEEPKVCVVVYRNPVTRHGNYQIDTVLRTIKPGSRNYRDALKAAGVR